ESKDGVYKFGPDEDNISIHFFSPLYSKPNKQLYRWRIDEGEWKYFSNLSFEVNLVGGSHQIEISTSSDNIEWSDETKIKVSKEEKLSEKTSIYFLVTLG